MTVVLMKNTPAGRRAYAISRVDADKLVEAGDAVQDKVHTGIYEEVLPEEREQGYLTRNLAALPVTEPKKKPGRPAKARVEEAPATPAED